MINQIGVMQGRLLPKYKNQYQAHPVGYWQDEFAIAAMLGLDLIEFIVDLDGIEQNPMMSTSGVKHVAEVIANTGVNVKSICADCFMDAPLHNTDSILAKQSEEYLCRLIENADELGLTDIVIPCVDRSSLQSKDDTSRFVSALESVLNTTDKSSINLSLETDLSPDKFSRLLELLSSPRVTVNYDTGNSASLGYNPQEELAAYGTRISDIHIKDRTLNGGSVPLGTGDTNFDVFFDALAPLNYKEHFILQAYRDDEGVSIFRKQLDWIDSYLEAFDQRVK